MPAEVAHTGCLLQAVNCLSFPPPPFLQLIPHFLSKIPPELLVCVFPQHVLICHPFPLASSDSTGFSGALPLQIAAVPRPGLWFWCDHWERQVPAVSCWETLPPLHLPLSVEFSPSGS